jgi:hypothetical protein
MRALKYLSQRSFDHMLTNLIIEMHVQKSFFTGTIAKYWYLKKPYAKVVQMAIWGFEVLLTIRPNFSNWSKNRYSLSDEETIGDLEPKLIQELEILMAQNTLQWKISCACVTQVIEYLLYFTKSFNFPSLGL